MPKVSSQVDRRSVVNPRQARALLGAVRAQQPSGPRLVTFFAVMYYAGLRPEEAISLSRDNVIMPTHDRPDSRVVPTHPELTRLLREHLDKFGTAPDGRLFGGVRGGELPTITYRRAWIKARQATLSAAEQASPLARRPYDLRHACLSTWLNGGVYPTQVAEWAGHGVDVLLRIYAKCVVGQDELAKRRISEALCRD
jgi:integrase